MSALLLPPEIVYPESDGKPMAENTKQARAITVAHGGIDALTASNPKVFAAIDNFVYPVEGRIDIVQAPDVYVAFGRPKGDRGSYRVWEEDGIFPQVIFEVLSPSNTKKLMAKKLAFYDEYGAEEYYVYDPDRVALEVYTRKNGSLVREPKTDGFVSPRLGIRFDLSCPEWVIWRPDGIPFESPVQLFERAQAEKARADAAQTRVDAAQARADRLAEKLRSLGIDPDSAG